MADTALVGHRMKFGIGAADPVTTRLALDSCTVKKIPTQIVSEEEMRGVISQDSESVVAGTYTVGGSVTWKPRPAELRIILPFIFGGTFATNTLDPALIDTPFYFAIDRIAKVYTYAGMKIVRAVFSSSAGQKLQLTLDLEGTTETEGNAGTFPSLTISTQTNLVHHNLTCTLNSSARNADNVQVVIENPCNTTRFFNSQTRTEVPNLDRRISVTCDVPYNTTNLALYNNFPLAGIAGNLAWNNSTLALTFAFPALQAAPQNTELGGKTSEQLLRLEMVARTKSGDAIPQEVQITLDDTP